MCVCAAVHGSMYVFMYVLCLSPAGDINIIIISFVINVVIVTIILIIIIIGDVVIV